MHRVHRHRTFFPVALAFLVGGVLTLSACAPTLRGNNATAAAPNSAGNTAADLERLHVLILNGGGRPPINYQSHLLHVQQFLEILAQAGLPDERISIFSSDGDDPGLDLALRQMHTGNSLWRLEGTGPHSVLRALRYVSTEVPGHQLQPATNAALSDWFAAARERLQPGDTLLLYVTDHGERNNEDLADNTITLWGDDEHLSVSALRDHLAGLAPGVRVVTLMSQCFSGSFYGITAARKTPAGLPDGSICGYFASTRSRPAYGCYPESRGRHNLGHSFHFFKGIAASGSFAAAHQQTLVTDATPDVPLRSSDLFLREQLLAAAHERGVSLRVLADELLEQAWKDRRRWESELRLLDRIGEAFGFFSPRSLAELEAQRSQLPGISNHLRRVSRAWQAALGDANRAQLARFFKANSEWQQRAARDKLAALDANELEVLAEELLQALTDFTVLDADTEARLSELHARGSEAAAASFRMQVRLAAVLRMRMTLLQIAGQTFLEKHGSAEQRATHTALLACEDLHLPGEIELAELAPTEAFPPFTEDVTRATAAMPAWIGISFRNIEDGVRKQFDLQPGATRVLTVFPDSPAAAAGLQTADILIGPPGEPFMEDREVRWWTMLGDVGIPRTLEFIRDGERREVQIVPGVYPLEWPSLPGPPATGDAAPALRVSAYRGDFNAVRGKPHVLFFWATWCAPCKAAVPDLLAFAAAEEVEIVAITDEPRDRLDLYFTQTTEFPAIVAIDDYRQTFQAYGVSGTPTFVLVDGSGNVRAVSTGFSSKTGIELPRLD